MTPNRLLCALLAGLMLSGLMFATAAEAASKRPGKCGVYMYYKAGKCLDARNKK